MLTLYDPEAELCEHIRCEVAQGRAEGEAKGLADSVSALMKKMNISKEQAMEMLDITGTNAEKISKLLKQ